MSSATAPQLSSPWYVVVLGLFFVAQAIPVAAIGIGGLYFFLPEFVIRLAYLGAGVGLLLRSRLARYLGLLVIFAEGISVVLTLLFWGLQFIWPAAEFRFSLKIYDSPLPTSPYTPALAFLALGFVTWVQYSALTTRRARNAFSVTSRLDRACLSLAGKFGSLLRKGIRDASASAKRRLPVLSLVAAGCIPWMSIRIVGSAILSIVEWARGESLPTLVLPVLILSGVLLTAVCGFTVARLARGGTVVQGIALIAGLFVGVCWRALQRHSAGGIESALSHSLFWSCAAAAVCTVWLSRRYAK